MSLRQLPERIEQYAVEIIYGRRRTWYDRVFRVLLHVLSHLYRIAVQFRLSLYRHNILKRQSIGSSVVSVGNLTVGGTGKTPVVELLAHTLSKRGRKVAILSRGYRSKPRTLAEKIRGFFSQREYRIPPKVVSDGTKVLLDSRNAGDEPYMLARNLVGTEEVPGVAVLVDKDRVHAGRYAVRRFQSDTLLLDDGFQYMQLRPRINIVLVDTTNPFHNHETLPIGLLREPLENIARADYIFLTKSNGRESLRHLEAFLHRHNPHCPIIECNHTSRHLADLWSGEVHGLEILKGKKIGTVCGIAVPESFENYIKDLGGSIVYRKRFVDHHRYTPEEMEDFFKASLEAGAELLVTTEKDAVRIPRLDTKGIPFLFLRVEISIIRGQEHFEECIASICMK